MKNAPSRRAPWMEPRHVIILATFLATFTAYVERVGFSIAFTDLAKEAGIDEAVKGKVLSAFYWGYALSQIPGGWAAQQYGGRIMLLLCFASWSAVSILTPTNARHTAAIVAARVCVGVAQGFLIPAVHTVLSQWIPPHERARAVSLTTSGMYLGSASAMLILPWLASIFGSASLLRIVGGLGLAWMVLWLAVGRDIPHRETVIPLSTMDHHRPNPGSGGAGHKGRPGPTPYRRMFASPAVWAIVVNNFSFHYGFYVIMNWLPTYFNHVLKVELSSLGGAKTVPYLVMFAMSNVGGWAGDWLILKRRYSTAAGRKAVNSLGFLSSAAALMLMPGASSVTYGVAVTTLTLGCLGFSRGGFSVNHMDIAPKYAGMVMGISNTAGTVSGVIGVTVTGYILDMFGGADNVQGWYMAHAVSAAICLQAMVVFNLFARGERLFD
ncbi:putative anion transporter 7 [Tetrabaena socialis]|uniref:Putative anion transporter 7 n=1 Tax=Tetrabaena socialis TaxID=47790 RepID=A0A2J8A4N2_9CHLO|nr:putative anion transporter 7 [Tetrabaena socialis]|eukprot:PNH07465.1 putative anion transporter 7 [Tetrabaena socialis]